MALRAFNVEKGGISSRSLKSGAITPRAMSDLVTTGQYVREACNYQPRAALSADGYGTPSGTAGTLNLLYFRNMNLGYSALGAGQTLLSPTTDATTGGLLFGLDSAAAEGHQGVFGALQTNKNPLAVTIGTSPNASVRATFRVATVANAGELAIGWRKAEAVQTNIDDYDEAAFLNMQAGDIKRETILNAAATTTVDTTQNALDATDFTMEVKLIGRNAIMLVNDREVAMGAPFQFDVGEVVVPFYFWLQGGAGSLMRLMDFEVGPLYAIEKDPARK